jgi:hypothetical protein
MATNSSEPWGRTSHLGETWLEGEREGSRKAHVRFPDGKLRSVRCAGTADTFFSIPVSGHDGYVTTKDDEFIFQPHSKAIAKYGDWPASI